MRMLKIESCSDRLMWYRDMVGETVPLVRAENFDANSYITRDRDGYTNIVLKSDASLVPLSEQMLCEG